MRSSPHPLLLAQGEQNLIRNVRWGENGAFVVRNGVVQYLATPIVNAVLIDTWAGEFNGDEVYLEAISLSGRIQIWASVNGAALVELTGTAGWFGDDTGNTRFPTVTDRVTFGVVKTPGGLDEGSPVIPRDAMVISNGTDSPRIWDPGQNAGFRFAVHDPLLVPDNAFDFRYKAGLQTFLQLAKDSAGRFYFSGTGVNDVEFFFADTTDNPFTAGSTVPELNVSSSVTAGKIATFCVDDPITLRGQLLFVVQGGSATDALDALNGAKIEISGSLLAYDLVPDWVTAYDPDGDTSDSFAAFLFDDDTSFRWIVAIPSSRFESGQKVRHIRMTWSDSSGPPATTVAIKFLMCASGGGWPGGTEWAISYADGFSRAETYGIEASDADVDKLSNCGGPGCVSSNLPLIEEIGYDYHLIIPNTDETAGFDGGLDGRPNLVPVYVRVPGQQTALYGFSLVLENAVTSFGTKGWMPAHIGPTFEITTDSLSWFNQALLDPTRTLPSAYQITIPPANAMVFASNRLFVGDIFLSDERARGDIYFSAAGQTFRFSSVPIDSNGNFDSSAGSRATLAGETIRQLIASASSAEGASFVYAFTSTALHMLGGGGILGGQTDAVSLGTPHRIGAVGTNCYRSVQERNGVIIWVDNENCVRRMIDATPMDISRSTVDDRITTIPASRRASVCAIWSRDRYYLAFTPEGGTTNTKMLVWHEPSKAWESEDLPPASYERLACLYDPDAEGSGRTLLGTTSAVVTYQHESGTEDLGNPVDFVVGSRELRFGARAVGMVDDCTVLSDALPGYFVTVDRLYRPYGSAYRSTITLETGFGSDSSEPSIEVTPPTDADGERGATARLILSGSLPGGTTLLSFVAAIRVIESNEQFSG